MTKYLLTTAALALLPAASFADSSDIIVTATGAPENSAQVGQSVTLIDSTTLAQQQTVVLSDILATVPGVSVARNGGVGSLTSVFIRGADSEQTLVVVDGVRVNDPTSPGGGYNFGNLLAGNVQSVEVLRGADSVPWGSVAIGGVVNVTTQAPTKTLTGALNAEGGSYDTKSVNASVSDTLGPVAFSFGGGWYNTGGISAAASGTEADGFDQHYLTGRAVVALSNIFSLDLRGRYARSNAQIDGYNNASFSFGDDSEYTVSDEISGYVGLNAKLLDGKFFNRLGYSYFNTQNATYDANGAYSPNREFGTPGFEYGVKGLVQRIEYHGDWQIIDPMRLVFGAEHEASRLYIDADYNSYNIPYSSPFEPAAAYRTHVDSVYGQAILTPFAGLTVTGGVRYDYHASYGGHTTFSANTAYKLTATTILRASYAEGFKAPTLYQLYAPYYGNSTLKPETATSYDAGIEQSALNGAVKASVTYFNRHSHDLIDYNFSTSTYFNIGAARAEGVEASVIVRPVSALELAFNYTHLKSINELTGLQLARRPEDSASLSLDWNAKWVKLGGTVQMVGNSYDNASNTVIDQSYVLVGLRVSAPVTDKIEVFGRIDNLFDEHYQVVDHYGTLGRAAYAGVRLKI